MYVCMYACMYVCMNECMYVCMYVVHCHVPCNWLNASSPSPSIPAVSNKIQWPASGVAVVLLLLGWVALSLGTPPSIPSSTSHVSTWNAACAFHVWYWHETTMALWALCIQCILLTPRDSMRKTIAQTSSMRWQTKRLPIFKVEASFILGLSSSTFEKSLA